MINWRSLIQSFIGQARVVSTHFVKTGLLSKTAYSLKGSGGLLRSFFGLRLLRFFRKVEGVNERN